MVPMYSTANAFIWIVSTFLICTVASALVFSIPKGFTFYSNDWYLGYQLVQLSKHFSENLWISPYTSFYNPATPGEPLFGQQVFSTGMLIWTPDILIFQFFNINDSIKIHYLFALLICIWSFNSIRVKLGLSFLTASSLTITWVISGPIAARMSEGHIQLLGYLMVPFFLSLVDDLIKLDAGKSRVPKKFQIAFTLLYITLLGSAHVFIQFSLVLMAVGALYKNARRTVLSGLAFGWAYSAFQYLPGILSPVFERQRRSVYQGYGWRFWENFYNGNDYYVWSWPEIMNVIVKLPAEVAHHYFVALTNVEYAISSGGWEWTLAIGLIPTLLIASVNLRYIRETIDYLTCRKYLVVVFILSIAIFYRILYLLVSEIFPFPAVDRVPYRMGVYLFASVLLVSFKNINRVHIRDNFLSKVISIGMLMLIPILVGLESKDWFMRLKEGNSELKEIQIQQILQPERNLGYENSVVLGALISIASIVATLVLLKKNSFDDKV
jgi:hypothetical protein